MRRLTPYLLLLPGAMWLLLFFAVPMGFMLVMSLQEGSLSAGYHLTWNWGIYPDVVGAYGNLIVRSVGYALATTLLTLAIGYPMAYTIAFYGGRLKNTLLLLVVMPFFVSFVIRTLNWRMILSDNGLVFGTLKDIGLLDHAFRFLATPASVIFGLTYNFLPFMVLPLLRGAGEDRPPPDRGCSGPVCQPKSGVLAHHLPALDTGRGGRVAADLHSGGR
jgi:ABC-type spermidine/putrescine transport system, permease component I